MVIEPYYCPAEVRLPPPCTLLYTTHTGQTGSGKTYTMLGDSYDLATAAGEGTAGLIPRICVELFQRFGLVGGGRVAGASRGTGQASIQVSFCEVRSICDRAKTKRELCSNGRP